jgi:hypothetical protein
MAEPAAETKSTVKKMSLGGIGKSLLGASKKAGGVVKSLFSKKPTSELVTDDKETPAEYLGEIYKLMKVIDEDKKLQHEKSINHIHEEEHKKDQRNKEIISALTGKKFKKTKFKARRKFKVKKKGKATNVSESGGGGLGLPSLGVLGSIALGGAAVVGTTALMTTSTSAFGNTMAMEQRVRTPEEALNASHKTAVDRDNSLSYGVIGLSSIRTDGKDNSSLDSFIKDNPQFNLPDPGNGGRNAKFIEEWNKIPADKLLEAQEKWYQDHVYNPATRSLESSGVDSKISADERVRAYMADRANQVGTDGTEKAIKRAGADKATTSEDFMHKMSEYDKAHLDEQFPKYLKQHPTHRKGLINRIENRESLSLALNPNAEENKSVRNTKLNPKQSASATSQNLEINDTESSATAAQLEKQRLEYEKQAQNGMDMGYKIQYPEQKSSNAKNSLEAQKKSAGLEYTGPLIPKPTIAPSDDELESKKYIENQKLRHIKMREEAEGPKIPQQSEENRKLWEQLELQDLIHKSTLLENQQKVNADLKAKEEDKLIENKEAEQKQIIQDVAKPQSNEPINPPVEDFDNVYDGPVMLQTHPVENKTIISKEL